MDHLSSLSLQPLEVARKWLHRSQTVFILSSLPHEQGRIIQEGLVIKQKSVLQGAPHLQHCARNFASIISIHF